MIGKYLMCELDSLKTRNFPESQTMMLLNTFFATSHIDFLVA